MTWTAEKLEQIKSLFESGRSYRQIAVELGVTRSMVGGKLKRLGLKRGKETADVYAARKRAREKVKKAKRREVKKQQLHASLRPETSKTSPTYRRSLPTTAPMSSKREMYEFLAEAVRNTVRLSA